MAGRKLFINYRREDSRADAGRLYDRLHGRYPGRVFRDIGSLEPGVEWHEAIDKVLGASDACVVVIGRNWLTVTDAAGKRRLDDARDTCRKEVATAIKSGMRIFPVLVGGAKMPVEEDLPEDLQALVRRNALEISEQDWDEDFEKLARAIEKALGWSARKPGARISPISAGVAAAVVAIVAVAIYAVTRTSTSPPDHTVVDLTTKRPVETPVKPGPVVRQPDVKRSPAANPDPVAPQPDARPPARVAQDPVGSWRGIFSQGSEALAERVEFYPDSSFRIVLDNNALAGIGRWQQDADGAIVITNAVSFVKLGVRFSCNLQANNNAGFSGDCRDTMNYALNVSLSGARRLSTAPVGLPRINISAGTMAEKAAFVESLAAVPCTCNCQRTVHNCLLEDPTCPLSPTLAQTQWAMFLRMTRA